ncbi:MAG: glycosyltransferase [Candidatus Hodarchaeota archaeon]
MAPIPSFSPKGRYINLPRERRGAPRKKKVGLFAGTPRPHNGVSNVVRALNIIDPNCGIGLLNIGGDRPRTFIPEILHHSNLVVIPQRDNFISRAQVPTKVFEAMAMAKPVIAIAVSDLREILKGCRLIIDPWDMKALAKSIQYVPENPDVDCIMGRNALD